MATVAVAAAAVAVPLTISSATPAGALAAATPAQMSTCTGTLDGIFAAWCSQGGAAMYGNYTGAETAAGGAVKKREFAKGTGYWSAAAGGYMLNGYRNSVYKSLGMGASPLGAPTSTNKVVAGGAKQSFQAGAIYTPSGSATAYAVYGGSYSAYRAAGETTGILGFPRGNEVSTAGNSRSQQFANGVTVWSQATGAQFVAAGMYSAYVAAGRQNGTLGLPTSGEYGSARSSKTQNFQGGIIIWSAATGAYYVPAALGGQYGAAGAQGGRFGLPIANPTVTTTAASVTTTQRFQGGTITQTTPRIVNEAAVATATFNAINAERAKYGLAPLKRDTRIDAVALNWSRQQPSFSLYTWTHNPNYSAQIPAGWKLSGENVAFGQSGYNDTTVVPAVVDAWMNSPLHRDNILNGTFNTAGMGVVNYNGTYYFTQNFARY